MRNRIYFSIAMLSISLFASNVSRAAFPVKKDAVKTEVASQPIHSQEEATVLTSAADNDLSTTAETKVIVKKQSFFSKVLHKIAKAEHAVISQAAYIVLAIFALGWLAMGINDNFQGFNWVLCLILYLLFWLPGFIYSLIEMGNYY